MTLIDVTAQKQEQKQEHMTANEENTDHSGHDPENTDHNGLDLGLGKVRKSGRVRNQPNFSNYEKMKSLIYFDPAIWLKDDAPTRRKKVCLFVCLLLNGTSALLE